METRLAATAFLAAVLTFFLSLGCHAAAAGDDGCIPSPERETTATLDLFPVFSQGVAVTVRTTLTMAVSRRACNGYSFVFLRLRSHEPQVAAPIVCNLDAVVRQGGKIRYAYLQGLFGCARLKDDGESFPALPYTDPEGEGDFPPFDPAEALEIVFRPSRWALGPSSPAPGATFYATPSTPTVTLALPARRERETAIEFRHAGLDHYFLTADPDEAAYLDSLGAESGWRRTGLTFPARGTTRVCRFYGSVTPGPNAHFFATEGPTCDLLKRLQAETPASQPRWNFEGFAFFATPVDETGRCPAATVPVYRAYNDGFRRGIDSNHRYALDRATFDEDIRRGWLFEGVAFCVPS